METIDLLIVEDSTHDIHMIERVLRSEKLTDKYLCLKDGEVAYSYLANPNSPIPSVVLLDIKLPKVSGLELLKKVRQIEHLQTLPIVMYSSSTQLQDISASYQNGANSYLAKPSGYQDLKKMLRLFTTYWLRMNK